MTTATQNDIQDAARAHAKKVARNKMLGKIFGGLVTWLIVIALGFCTTYYGAYVLSYHWQWFFVPEGFDPLSLRQRLGICIIFGLLMLGTIATLVMNGGKKKDDDDDVDERYKAFGRVGGLAVAITISWASGWCCR